MVLIPNVGNFRNNPAYKGQAGGGVGSPSQVDVWLVNAVQKLQLQMTQVQSFAALSLQYDSLILFNDLATPSSMVNLGASTVAPTVDATAGNWPGSLLFAGAADNDIGGILQLPSRWQIGTTLSPRAHVARTTASSAAMTWNLYWRACAPVAGTWSAWSAPIAGTVLVIDPGGPDLTMEYSFGDLDMTGFGFGTLLAWRLVRVGSTDAYNANARFFTIDFPFRRDYDGSVSVDSK